MGQLHRRDLGDAVAVRAYIDGANTVAKLVIRRQVVGDLPVVLDLLDPLALRVIGKAPEAPLPPLGSGELSEVIPRIRMLPAQPDVSCSVVQNLLVTRARDRMRAGVFPIDI